jgi:hypothetical protein
VSEEPKNNPPPDGSADGAAPPDSPPPERAALAQTISSAARHAEEILDHVLLLLRVQRDRASLASRRAIERTILVAIIGIACAAAIVAGTVMLLEGIAGALTQVLGGAPWMARLLTGAAVLAGAIAVTRLVFARKSATILRERQQENTRIETQQIERQQIEQQRIARRAGAGAKGHESER